MKAAKQPSVVRASLLEGAIDVAAACEPGEGVTERNAYWRSRVLGSFPDKA